MMTRYAEGKWARRHGTSEQIFYGLVRRYDVRVQSLSSEQSRELGGDLPRGPKGHGCLPSMRTIFLNPPGRNVSLVRDGTKSINVEPENYIHELAHVITQPPFRSIDDTPEDFILMQFERSLTRECFSPLAYERVVGWQLDTEVSATGMALGDTREVTTPYGYAGWWRAGFVFCRKLGILDENNRPTYRWPDWGVINEETAERIMNWYFGDEPASLLSIAQGL